MAGASYDNIVIGAGSAGCAVAARLSEDRQRRVLLVEAGGSNRRLDVRMPAAFPKQFHSKVDWDYWTEPEPALNERRIYEPRGKMLGGSSSTNAMVYIRGNRADYEGWVEQGAEGWDYDEVLPVFRRSEHNEQFDDAYHGRGGPLNVTRIPTIDPVSTAFVDAAAALGLARNDDPNGAEQEGAGRLQVTQKRGRRQSAAESFLRGARRRPNLSVRTGTCATRLVLRSGRVSGVELHSGGRTEVAPALGEVIVAGGAFNSPALLQHSGIGPAEHLRSVGVEALIDLPAVGRHLMEHPIGYCAWELAGGHVGLADAEEPRYLLEWLLLRRGKLASNVAETGAHWRSEASLSVPDFQLLFAPAYFVEHGLQSWDAPAATIALSYLTPKTRGSVLVRDANPLRKSAVRLNLLADPEEMAAMTRAVRFAREIGATAPAREMLGMEIQPGEAVQSDEEIVRWLRASAQHTYHPSCSCRIGSPTDGVVDPSLRVHGVENLRIADTSVMPTIIRGNTNAPAIMIGERCAEFIRSGRGESA